mmetsp:Transcript_15978/g.34741  ORF Transcript_15978/g.34741 Transcript_15978/m.34741 type:complete len:427 (+) Transcript_15978:168-1448(+)
MGRGEQKRFLFVRALQSPRLSALILCLLAAFSFSLFSISGTIVDEERKEVPNVSTGRAPVGDFGKGPEFGAFRSVEKRRLGQICGLPFLVQAIRHDTESNSLRPLSLNPSLESREFSFSGLNDQLLEETFHGKRLVLFGDSTLWYFTKWLNIALRGDSCPPQLLSEKLSLANARVAAQQTTCFASEPSVYGATPPPAINLRNGTTQVQWMGFAGSRGEITETLLKQLLQQRMFHFRPDVVVFNLGLHILHFAGEARNPTVDTVHIWIHYEEWLQAVINSSEAAGAKLLLFKTTNYICDARYTGRFAVANTRYRDQNVTTFETCQAQVQKVLDGEESTKSTESYRDISNFCQHASFNENGVQYLNQRLRDFLKNNASVPSGLDVGLFNDHDMQTCRYTEVNDGRHYHNLNLARIRMMANHFQCYLNE